MKEKSELYVKLQYVILFLISVVGRSVLSCITISLIFNNIGHES